MINHPKLLESRTFTQCFNELECFPRNRTHDCAPKREIMCSTYRHKGRMQNNFSWERKQNPHSTSTAKSCLLDTRNGTSPSKSYFKHFLIPNILVKFKLNEYFILQKGVFYSIECPCINNSIWPKMRNHVFKKRACFVSTWIWTQRTSVLGDLCSNH